MGPGPPFTTPPSVGEEGWTGSRLQLSREGRLQSPDSVGALAGRGCSSNRMLPLAPFCLLLRDDLQADICTYLHGLTPPSSLPRAGFAQASPPPAPQTSQAPQPSASLLLLQEAFPHHSGVRIPLPESFTTSTQAEPLSPPVLQAGSVTGFELCSLRVKRGGAWLRRQTGVTRGGRAWPPRGPASPGPHTPALAEGVQTAEETAPSPHGFVTSQTGIIYGLKTVGEIYYYILMCVIYTLQKRMLLAGSKRFTIRLFTYKY